MIEQEVGREATAAKIEIITKVVKDDLSESNHVKPNAAKAWEKSPGLNFDQNPLAFIVQQRHFKTVNGSYV